VSSRTQSIAPWTRIASVTKSFTAVAIMKLVEAGKLKLDNPIGPYLEGLPESWRMVKVRQLLGHTSGLPDVVVSGNPDPIRTRRRKR
jgi:CubicO group peptidase (beta-lactamase class C family)